MKKIKFCFNFNDYKIKPNNDKIFIILDWHRHYYAIQFVETSNRIKYGNLICDNSGIEYDGYFIESKMFEFIIYYKSIFFKLNKIKFKRKINV